MGTLSIGIKGVAQLSELQIYWGFWKLNEVKSHLDLIGKENEYES